MKLLPGIKSIWFWLIFILVIGGASGAGYLWWQQSEVDYPKEIREHAEALHERIISLDGHISIPMDFNIKGTEANKDSPYQFDLVKAASGRLSGAVLAMHSWPALENGPNAPHHPTPGFIAETRHQLETRYKIVTNIVRDYPNQVGIAYSPEDLRRLYDENKFAIVLGLTNAYPFGNDISEIDRWVARGVRVFGFSFVGNNDWADSSRPLGFFNDIPDALDGLSETGKQAVMRLNDLGVIIDVSQMTYKGIKDVTKLTRAPIIASHSSVRGLFDTAPNLSDKELLMIKNTGGVLHISSNSRHLRPLHEKTVAKINALRKKYNLAPFKNPLQALAPASEPATAIWPEEKFGKYMNAQYEILGHEPENSIDEFVDAIDYAVAKIGIDHVGIGSDFNDGGGLIGWRDVSDTRNITMELIERGYSDTDIEKLWGGNFLRIWKQVQAQALPATSQSE
ncbi:dipeptidase [Nitrosomonas sp.]|uniref:dipeptidase n=1 Tax=Nitrosomonas sp. TaxID=42353 RepID=UPI0037C6ACC9